MTGLGWERVNFFHVDLCEAALWICAGNLIKAGRRRKRGSWSNGLCCPEFPLDVLGFGQAKPRAGQATDPVCSEEPVFSRKKSRAKNDSPEAQRQAPCNNTSAVLVSGVSDILRVWCLGRSPMFVGRGKNTVLFPSLWGLEDWGLPRSGKGKARPAEALPAGLWPGFSMSLPGSL